MANPIAPEHLELMIGRPRGARAAGAARRRGVLRAVGAGVGRRLRRRAEPRAADVRLGALRQRASRVDDFIRSTSTSCRSTRRRSTAVAPHVDGARRGRGPRRPRRLRPHARQPVSRPRADDARPRRPRAAGGLPLAAGRRRGAAQHQRVARSAAARRSPTRSPTSVLDALDWHRYPDRAADRAARRASPRCHGVDRARTCSRPTARTRCCRRCCSPTAAPGRSALVVRADVRAAQPHRPHHRHRRSWRRARPPTSRSTSTRRAAVLGRRRPDDHVPVLAQQPDRHGRAAADGRSMLRRGHRGLVVVDEAYGAVRAVVGARPASTTTRPLVVTRTYSKTWSMAAAPPRLPRRARRGRRRARQGRAAVPPRRRHAARRRRSRSTSPTRWTRASPRLVEERGRLVARSPSSPVDVCPSGANFVLFRPRAVDGARRVAARCVDRSVLVRDCSSWPRLDGCLRVTVGTPDENDAFLAALGRGRCPMSRDRATAREDRDTKETDDRRRPRPRRRRATSTVDHRHPVLRPHARASSGKHGGFDLDGRAPPATSTSTPTTRSRTSASRSARRSARRSATRPACAASRQRLVPARRGARARSRSTCRAGRSSSTRSTPFGESGSATRVRPAARRGVLAGVRHGGRRSRCTSARVAARTPTTSSRRRSRAWPAALRDAVRVEGDGRARRPRARCRTSIPSIDLRGGNVVRLSEGDFDGETRVRGDPVASRGTSRRRARRGSTWSTSTRPRATGR